MPKKCTETEKLERKREYKRKHRVKKVNQFGEGQDKEFVKTPRKRGRPKKYTEGTSREIGRPKKYTEGTPCKMGRPRKYTDAERIEKIRENKRRYWHKTRDKRAQKQCEGIVETPKKHGRPKKYATEAARIEGKRENNRRYWAKTRIERSEGQRNEAVKTPKKLGRPKKYFTEEGERKESKRIKSRMYWAKVCQLDEGQVKPAVKTSQPPGRPKFSMEDRTRNKRKETERKLFEKPKKPSSVKFSESPNPSNEAKLDQKLNNNKNIDESPKKPEVPTPLEISQGANAPIAHKRPKGSSEEKIKQKVENKNKWDENLKKPKISTPPPWGRIKLFTEEASLEGRRQRKRKGAEEYSEKNDFSKILVGLDLHRSRLGGPPVVMVDFLNC